VHHVRLVSSLTLSRPFAPSVLSFPRRRRAARLAIARTTWPKPQAASVCRFPVLKFQCVSDKNLK
jgi:hypothetical protein